MDAGLIAASGGFHFGRSNWVRRSASSDGITSMRILALITYCGLVVLATRVNAQSPGKEAGQWTVPAGDYANTRYTPLDQITRDNVKDLKVAWTFDTGVNRGQEAAPLVVGD